MGHLETSRDFGRWENMHYPLFLAWTAVFQCFLHLWVEIEASSSCNILGCPILFFFGSNRFGTRNRILCGASHIIRRFFLCHKVGLEDCIILVHGLHVNSIFLPLPPQKTLECYHWSDIWLSKFFRITFEGCNSTSGTRVLKVFWFRELASAWVSNFRVTSLSIEFNFTLVSNYTSSSF